ncbi:MAG: restriction endonuclease [Actinomycetia bacterium]|jgi:restriction system protein|nr:restriction endonuclease [Actinomycetes bacterium]
MNGWSLRRRKRYAIVPSVREYRYVQRRDAIDELTRPIKEVKDRYAYLIARVALRTMHEVFAVSTDLVEQVIFNGRVSLPYS